MNLSAPTGGTLACHATNVGKKPLTLVAVQVIHASASTDFGCGDVPPQSDAGGAATCSVSSSESGLCLVTIEGGNHRSVRAVLNVVDGSGATILSVPATK